MGMGMGVIKEFKAFAMRGNVLDMAVGVVIGATFGKIVTSAVNDVMMPPIGLLTGGMDFSRLSVTLRPAAEGVEAVTLRYGAFINSMIDFVIVAFCVFLLVKVVNSAKRRAEEAPAPVQGPSEEVLLLAEIRDLLKKR
jgi:large conductance mechanosensitive channel